jgi:hypothetical protein
MRVSVMLAIGLTAAFVFVFAPACGTRLLVADDPASGADGGGSDGGVTEASSSDGQGAFTDGGGGDQVFPFAMTFESGLFGATGANQPTAAGELVGPGTALFGSRSAVMGDVSSVTPLTRSFPPQAEVYVSFYVRLDTATTGSMFQLRGLSGTTETVLVEIAPVLAGRTGVWLLVPGGSPPTTSIGELPLATIARIGVHYTHSATPSLQVSFDGAMGAGASFPIVTGWTNLPERGRPSSVVLGNLGESGAPNVKVVVDEIYGRADAYAAASR